MEQIFIDGVDTFSLASGIVRINTIRNTGKTAEDSPADASQTKFLATPGPQLVMTPETFARLHAGMKSMFEELVNRGILKGPADISVETTRATNTEISFD